MKNLFVISLLLIVNILAAQTPRYPYPVIFLHGLTSCDTTWNVAAAALGGSTKVFDACLNHDGSNTTASLTSTDIDPIGWRDGTSTPSPTRLYVMNYDNTRFAESGHSTHTLSNQAAIMKQGIALKAMIEAVLSIENTDKVILVGHSMGGLEIREYLQRGYDGSSGSRGTNWVDQTSSSGHRVARVVTTGTPHLGSNMTGGALGSLFPQVDEHSEACRDLRYPYSIPFPPASVPAPYLFGGLESAFQWSPSPYNLDVNCNGVATNTITGISSGTTYNTAMPLPTNIRYTYITSNFSGTNQDGLVETSRMWLYSSGTPTPASADTILLNINHLAEPSDPQSLIRGMDEPGDTTLAYAIPVDHPTKCFITYTTNFSVTDRDAYKVWATTDGQLTFKISGTGSGIDSLAVSAANGTFDAQSGVIDDSSIITVSGATAGALYYVTVRGTATATTWQNPYTFTVSAPEAASPETVYVGSSQTYGSLTGTGGLFEEIDAHGLSANLVAIITSDLSETGLFSLHQWTETGGSGYTLHIQPDGTVERLISGNVDSMYGMIRFDGSDRIIIDGRYNGSGRYFRLRNTNEGGPTISVLNGVANFTLRNCIVEGTGANDPYATIFLYGESFENTGVTIAENMIRDRTDGTFRATNGIRPSGHAGNSDIFIANNEFLHYDNSTIFGYDTKGNHWNISGNSFYSTKTERKHFAGIILDFTVSNNDTISNNYFGGQAPFCGGNAMLISENFTGINLSATGSSGNVIMNNVIQNIDGAGGYVNPFNGISLGSGGAIRNNLIGNITDSTRGITSVVYCDNSTLINAGCDTVDQNTISNFTSVGVEHAANPAQKIKSPSGSPKDGQPSLYFISAQGPISSVTRNRITSIHLSGIFAECTGLSVYDTNACSIVNNMISFAIQDSTTTLSNYWGIRAGCWSGNAVKVDYNTVALGGKILCPWTTSGCFSWDQNNNSSVNLKNNIFQNTLCSSGSNTVITTYDTAQFTSDYNTLYSTHPDSLCKYYDNMLWTEAYFNFAGWKSATGEDTLSANVPVQFADEAKGDLHLAGSSLGNIAMAGTPIAGITTDIDGDPRNPFRPYMGADENTAYPLNGPASIEIKVNDKWNMVSAPFTVADYHKSVLFGTAISEAFMYYSGYSTQNVLQNSVGYWLKFEGSQTIPISGQPRLLDTITVAQGWNLIGSLSVPIAVNRVGSIESGLIVSPFFEYKNKAYAVADSLRPGQGYWVKAGQDGQIILAAPSIASSRNRIIIQPILEQPPSPPMENGQSGIDRKPVAYKLEQAFPNPFNPAATIRYQLPVESNVRLTVYSALGQEVAVLIDESQAAGYKQITWNAFGRASGLYYCRLEAASLTHPTRSYTQVQKLLLVK